MLTTPIPDSPNPPEWIELIPAGPVIAGIDGRSWLNDMPARIVTAFTARNRPLVIDWEHASEHRAPVGLDAPAAGWIDRLEARSGAIWGHVSTWTARAAQQLQNREYRFLSPVFLFEKATSRIMEMVSVGLTNSPNLTLVALNQGRGTFATNAALRAEFGDAETFDAYTRAVAAGANIIGGTVITLTPAEREVARLFGRSEADWIKEKRTALAEARNTHAAESRMTAEERRVCEVMGINPIEFIASKEQSHA